MTRMSSKQEGIGETGNARLWRGEEAGSPPAGERWVLLELRSRGSACTFVENLYPLRA